MSFSEFFKQLYGYDINDPPPYTIATQHFKLVLDAIDKYLTAEVAKIREELLRK